MNFMWRTTPNRDGHYLNRVPMVIHDHIKLNDILWLSLDKNILNQDGNTLRPTLLPLLVRTRCCLVAKALGMELGIALYQVTHIVPMVWMTLRRYPNLKQIFPKLKRVFFGVLICLRNEYNLGFWKILNVIIS